MAEKQEAETMDTLLSIPIYPKYNDPLKIAAKADGRSVAGHIRWLIIQDLRSRGLVGDDLEPVSQGAE
jgi:hypothetical protein